jgi:hypothetical protein
MEKELYHDALSVNGQRHEIELNNFFNAKLFALYKNFPGF